MNRISKILVLSLGISLLQGYSARLAAETGYMEQPFAVAAIAGIERIEVDLWKLGELSGNHKPINEFHSLQENLERLPGVDRRRPIGGLLVLHRKKLNEPALIVILPVSDGEQLIASLQKKIPVFESVESGKWKVNLPKLKLTIRLRDEHLIIGTVEETFSLVTSEVLKTINSTTEKNDIFISIRRDGIPEEIQQRIGQKFNAELEKDLQRKESEDDDEFRLRSLLLNLVQQTGNEIMSATEEISAGIQITSDIQLNADWRVNSESELASILAEMSLATKRIGDTPAEEHPLEVQIGLNLPQPVQSFAFEIFKILRGHIKREIGPHLAEADRGPVAGAFDAIEQTIRMGKLDALVAFHDLSDGRMVLVGGLAVLGEELLATSLATILPYARESDEVIEVEMNVFESHDLKLHRLRGENEREEDKRLYGPNASFYIGTGSHAFWLAAGEMETPNEVQKLEDNKGHKSPPVLSVDFSFDPWLRLGEKNREDLKKIKQLRRAFPNDENDHVNFELKTDRTGVHAKLKADSGFLKLLGIALNEE